MAPYQYLPLTDSALDIRLITLLPGQFDDDIRIKISHVPLKRPVEPNHPRMTVKELQKTVPPNYEVFENLEGQFIFQKDQRQDNSWRHPDPDFNHSWYNLPVDGLYSDHVPAFDALSYVWGPETSPETVYLEKQQVKSSMACNQVADTLAVRQNLSLALKYLRLQDATRTLWVDAICIDQNNETERSAQVMRMHNIYTLAHRVVIWLGPESENSKLASTTLDHLGSQVECTKNHFNMASPNATGRSWFRTSSILPYSTEQWDAIHDLMARSWFSRLWVCQEAQLANSRAIMQCGMDECLWSKFRRAVLTIRTKQQPLSAQLRDQLDLIWQLVRHLDRPLLKALDMSAGRQCSGERDRVYGLLGLMPSAAASKIVPDYSRSESAVLEDIFTTYLLLTSRLDMMISFCDFENRYNDGPTWVFKHWATGFKSTRFALSFDQFAAGHSRAQWAHHEHHVLEVSGLQCATISAVSASAPYSFARCLETVRSWEPVELLSNPYIAGGSSFDAYASTLVTNGLKERWGEKYSACPLQRWRDKVSNRLCQSAVSHGDADSRDKDIWRALKNVHGRCLLTTYEGHFGLGSGAAQPGDMVCVLLGCQGLVLLRPTGLHNFQVVSECYVHGLTDAAGLLGPLPPGVTLQIYLESRRQVYSFFDLSTGSLTEEDPRLPPLSSAWERFEKEWTRDEPEVCAWFRNTETGEEMDSDPRMLPEALKERGVPLRTFRLV